MAKDKAAPGVTVGSVWMSNDKRFGEKARRLYRFRVVGIVGDRATVENIVTAKRTRTIALERFKPTSTGYVPTEY